MREHIHIFFTDTSTFFSFFFLVSAAMLASEVGGLDTMLS